MRLISKYFEMGVKARWFFGRLGRLVTGVIVMKGATSHLPVTLAWTPQVNKGTHTGAEPSPPKDRQGGAGLGCGTKQLSGHSWLAHSASQVGAGAPGAFCGHAPIVAKL